MAKLDPDNAKTAKNVLDEQAENARKRKREEGSAEEPAAFDGISPEQPLLRVTNDRQQLKKQKTIDDTQLQPSVHVVSKEVNGSNPHPKLTATQPEAKAAKEQEKAAKRLAKSEKKAEKSKTKREKKKGKESLLKPSITATVEKRDVLPEDEGDEDPEETIELGLINDRRPPQEEPLNISRSTASPSPAAQSTTFDKSNPQSGSSSISSILPSADGASKPPEISSASTTGDHTSESTITTLEENRLRFQKRLEELRAARKADVDGAPARTRQELIEARRRKEEERKAQKKELRRKAKEEESVKLQETIARGSPLLSGSPLTSPGSPAGLPSASNNFSFNRIQFGNGERASSSLNQIITPSHKSKGPSDPRTALQAAERQDARLGGLDPSKRAQVAEKNSWLHAKQRAEGWKVRDDTSLLKKTLKRKEKQKRKSEREWQERLAGVDKGKAARQQKRETNLAKRREEKGQKKGGGKGSKGTRTGATKGKKRPGFEGSFRAQAPRAAGAEKPRRR